MNPMLGYLASTRVNKIMQGLSDPRLLPQQFRWNNRIPDVPAAEEEIMAKYVGTTTIADLVADDAEAVVYDAGRIQYESYKVPNLKYGLSVNQAMLNSWKRLSDLSQGGAFEDELGLFNNMQAQMLLNVRYGVEMRKETLKLAMLLDGYNYDRLGIKLTGATWGMYPDLKVTPTTAWSSTSSTPLTDINTVRSVAQQRYGVTLNRATMSTPVLRAIVQTTEYQNQVKSINFSVLLGGPGPAAPLQSDQFLRRQAEIIIGGTGEPFTIEIDDRRYWQPATNGSTASVRIHPINAVLLTDPSNDGNSMVYDFANGIVTESIVANMVPTNVIGNVPVGRGPIAYTTPANPSMNPPGIVTWGVARGFPRKHMNAASAVLSVGSFTETYDTTLPAVV